MEQAARLSQLQPPQLPRRLRPRITVPAITAAVTKTASMTGHRSRIVAATQDIRYQGLAAIPSIIARLATVAATKTVYLTAQLSRTARATLDMLH